MNKIVLLGINNRNGLNGAVAKYYADKLNCEIFTPDTITEISVQFIDIIVLIVPEYNGTFPGELKQAIDTLPYNTFNGKKIVLAGTGGGHSGNLLGLSHLTDMFMYLNCLVMPYRVTVPKINEVIDKEGRFLDLSMQQKIDKQIELINVCFNFID